MLSDLCSAGNLDDLLDDVTGLVGFCLIPESYESSRDVYNESSKDDEDEESEEISIFLCVVWTRSCSFVCSIAAFAAFWSSGTCCSLFIQDSISSCFFCYSDYSCDILIHSSSFQASS